MATKVTIPLVQAPKTDDTNRWRPEPFEGQPDKINLSNLDTAFKATFDNIYGLEATSPQVPDDLKGSGISSGALKVTGSAKGIVTGLDTVSNVVVSLDSGPAASNLWVTATPSTTVKGAFDVYVWKPTGAGSTVPIANGTVTTVRWIAFGTKIRTT